MMNDGSFSLVGIQLCDTGGAQERPRLSVSRSRGEGNLTFVLGASYDDPIVVEEQFGPTVPIVPYDDEEQGISLVNNSIYGLTSSVWGEQNHAIQVARRIEAGTTMINTAAVQGLDVRFPFGGVKQSGVGREYGEEGLLGYTETHVINAPKHLELPYIPE
ncbi:hypothetical protein GCM10025859_50120 [Alicyclobacillus fastidiosus]|nr:hypothetical protein GCM10025859_50120 [Alicyclobacillus fastidiosus]